MGEFIKKAQVDDSLTTFACLMSIKSNSIERDLFPNPTIAKSDDVTRTYVLNKLIIDC